MSTAPIAPSLASDMSLADNFDAPVVEVIRYRLPDPANPGQTIVASREVTLVRPDMDYWTTWAAALREKRRVEALAEINKQLGLNPLARAQGVAEVLKRDVQIFEVLDMQYIPAGIAKIIDDAIQRGGITDLAERKRIRAAIPPIRQQMLAGELCSEPRATVEQLRDSIKRLALTLGQLPGDVSNWDDARLIEFSARYTPPPQAAKKPGGTFGAGDAVVDEGEDTTANPTAPGDVEPGAM